MGKNNILVIVTDQLSQKAVGAYGNKDVKTPNIDSIASRGIRFDNAYTPCPLCCPARASFWTGLLPHTTHVESNGNRNNSDWKQEDISSDVTTLGDVFTANGYECVHFGKTHDAGTLRGFQVEQENELPVNGSPAWPLNYDSRRDEYTVKKSIEFLNQEHEKPFLMVADIQNPHDICNWVGVFKGDTESITGPGLLPQLPDNFENQDWKNRPLPVQYICCSHRRVQQAAKWTKKQFRHYLAAYYHYVNRADECIGKILHALKESGQMENTLLVFLSDHGDGMGSHRMVTKQVSFIEETTRVPFIFAGPGISFHGSREIQQLVSLDDLFPTLCDYANITPPDNLYGKSLIPYLNNNSNVKLRDYVISEWTTEWGFTISPGRMLRSDRYKYVSYLENQGEEFFDLEKDPGETISLVGLPKYQSELKRHRKWLQEHLENTNDNFLQREIKVDPLHRSHEPGYWNHEGFSAVDC